ncbi:aspartate kinase [Sediminibacterium ginsengisoli]|uniref:Aspartokinase n=1 Tax=Sediminibacterium ginsengisoli TaxID=413434 RepID=A0A1T4P4H5_9BACT|nr:aspartate kinase [Sediminibacterium ginsengisoli]SJZ86455.1 aspartate kinase [Sediminibacterium ginsengisoli]
MKVFKFGGASVNSVERIKNLAAVLREYPSEQLVVIISAMGKTTNALEKVAEAFYAGKKEEALELFNTVKNQHLNTAKYLLVTRYNACYSQLNDFFTEVEWLLHDQPVREFDYYYDQIVCAGELFSTAIISHFLAEDGIGNEWLDVRDLIRTDNNFRDAAIDWPATTQRIRDEIGDGALYITQGFIGSTNDNENTTLGREGSDYTAAVFANILNAESLTIWKDVEGVMNADPKTFEDTQLISELSFREVIEMAYYGAQVIHPKTIKPLQNKNIPLYVKCFLNPALPGTVIHGKTNKNLPPIFVIKNNQALVQLNSQDFSFVGEKPVAALYELFSKLRISTNLVQTGAISVMVCLDDKGDKTDQLAAAASEHFDVQIEKGLHLLTIRHGNEKLTQTLTAGKSIVLMQRSPDTIQVLYRDLN